jgi:hypothetical protein
VGGASVIVGSPALTNPARIRSVSAPSSARSIRCQSSGRLQTMAGGGMSAAAAAGAA